MPQSLEDLVKRARELKKAGLSVTEISEELKLDGETVLWFLMGREKAPPSDVYIDLSNIVRAPERTSMLGAMLASLIEEVEPNLDAIVASGESSAVLGFAIASELGTELYFAKLVGEKVHLAPEGYPVEGKKVAVVQDIIAGGMLASSTVAKLQELGADVRLVATFLNKRDIEEVAGVKVVSLVGIRKIEQEASAE